MTTIYAPHKPSRKQLAEVVEAMRTLGTPTIRAVWTGDCYMAIEGSHRIAAAVVLGIAPEIVSIKEDDVICDHDIQDLPSAVTVSEILEHLYNTPEVAYQIDL